MTEQQEHGTTQPEPAANGPAPEDTSTAAVPADGRALDTAEAEAAIEAVRAIDEEPIAPPAPRRRANRKAALAEASPPADMPPATEAGEAPATIPGTVTQPAPAAELPARPASRPESIVIESGGVAEAEADRIEIGRGGIGVASADSIRVQTGGIGRARAEDIGVRLGGVGIARAERVSVELGAVGAAIASRVTVTQGYARTVLGREVHLHSSGSRMVLGQRVVFGDRSGALLVLARKTEGNVRTLLDWRAAAILGGALAVVAAILRPRTERRSRG